MKPEFDIPVELHRLLQGMIRLSDGVRLIACTKGSIGANIAKRWPMPVYPGPGEREALEASTHELFGYLSRGEIAALYVSANKANPIEIEAKTWSFHGYDAVGWETSGIKTDGSPIEDIKLMADDVLRLMEQPAGFKAPELQQVSETVLKQSALRLGRPSYRKYDEPLIEEMHELIITEKATSMIEAARMVAPKAKRIGVEESAIHRLRKGYSAWRKSLEKNGL